MTHSTVPVTRPATVPANNRFVVGILVGALVSLGLVGIAVGSGAATRLASVPLGPMESRAYTQSFDGASRANVLLQFGALAGSILFVVLAAWESRRKRPVRAHDDSRHAIP
jgi:hypothetical protein